jgi:hypothetical protein
LFCILISIIKNKGKERNPTTENENKNVIHCLIKESNSMHQTDTKMSEISFAIGNSGLYSK